MGTRRGISLPNKLIHEGNEKITLPLEYNCTNENDVSVPCTWELTNLETKKVVATGNLNS